MPTHIGIGFSQNPNPTQAAEEAIIRAKTQANQLNINLVIVFSTIHYCLLETARLLRRSLPNSQILGVSTAGVILSEFIAQRGIAVLVISSDQIHFGASSIMDLNNKDLHQAGITLAKETVENFGQHRRQIFGFFTDGLLKNSFELLGGIQEVFGHAFPIIGAGSSDDFHFKRSYQFFQDKIMTSSACGFLMGGQMSVGFGNGHGWKPLGKPRVITELAGAVIKTIDGKRASLIYEEYFQKTLQELSSTQFEKLTTSYPLGIFLPEEKQYLLRNAIAILNDGSLVCQGNIPANSEVHVMIGSKETCRQAAVEAAQQARDRLYGKKPKLILIFESLLRQKLLGRDIVKELHSIREIFGHGTPILGMYAHGEVAPVQFSNETSKTHLQNESITILAIE